MRHDGVYAWTVDVRRPSVKDRGGGADPSENGSKRGLTIDNQESNRSLAVAVEPRLVTFRSLGGPVGAAWRHRIGAV